MHRLICALILLTTVVRAAEPLHVCATVTDLGDLVRAVGGDDVQVTVFARGGDDPHFVDPRPGFAKALAKADLVVSIGLELEIGWLPVVVTQARNPRLVAGQPAWLEASSAIEVQGKPSGDIDRSHGHVHAGGNPHFLSDPVRGIQVAHAIAVRLGEIAPDRAEACTGRYRTFALDLGRRLLGEAVVKRVGDAGVLMALEKNRLRDAIGDGADLGGWLAQAKAVRGASLVADHDLWPYLAERLGFRIVAFLEPEPGVPPTTRHLADVASVAKNAGAAAIISTPYFDPRHARFVADRAGIPVVVLAHQAGSLEDAPDWMGMLDRNVRALAAAMPAPKP